MNTITIEIINAFVDGDQGGNPAGVVFHADGLDSVAKQAIARQAGFSETAFVSKSSVADYKLDFFTPTRQIAHCGHATIATFAYLAQQGLLGDVESSKETIDGRRRIVIDGDMAFMEQRAPAYTRPESRLEKDILRALGLSPADLLPELDIEVVDTGNRFLIVAVKNQAILRDIVPEQSTIGDISERLGLIGVYVYTPQSVKPGRDATARMFAPFYGISEEAATGMAAGPLACYLRDCAGVDKTEFLIEQGYFMTPPSGSVITVKLDIKGARIQSLLAGGRARQIKRISVAFPAREKQSVG